MAASTAGPPGRVLGAAWLLLFETDLSLILHGFHSYLFFMFKCCDFGVIHFVKIDGEKPY